VNFDGGVTLEEFSELLTPTAFGHPAWRFNAPYLEIEANDNVFGKYSFPVEEELSRNTLRPLRRLREDEEQQGWASLALFFVRLLNNLQAP